MAAKVGQVAIYVDDLQAAIDDFSYVFGIEFKMVRAEKIDVNVAVSDSGLVLVGKDDPAPRAIEDHWYGPLTALEVRVDDLPEARRRMEERGSRRLYGIDAPSGFHEHFMVGSGFGKIPVTIFEIQGESWVDSAGAGDSVWSWEE